jgi:hypothetical protein
MHYTLGHGAVDIVKLKTQVVHRPHRASSFLAKDLVTVHVAAWMKHIQALNKYGSYWTCVAKVWSNQ